MGEDTAMALLRQVPWFRHLDGARLEELARQSRRRRFGPGEALFHQGDPAHTIYVVVAGRVCIQKITPRGEIVQIASRGPGELFGELGVLDGEPRMADAVTACPSDLLMLDRHDFVHCLETTPALALAVMRSLAARLREAGEDLEAHRQRDVLGRLCGVLLKLAKVQGVAEAGGRVRVAGRVTHRQLADEIGATRESVSRALAGLRDARAVRTEGRTLVLLNLEKLRQCSAR